MYNYTKTYRRRSFWEDYGPAIFYTLTIISLVAGMIWMVYESGQNQRQFRQECIQVQGTVSRDSDGDLECYKNGREIAEYGENSPLHPEMSEED